MISVPAPSTTYNPGYQEQQGGSRRYLSEGELLGEGGQPGQGAGGVGPSTSAGQLQVSYQSSMLIDLI